MSALSRGRSWALAASSLSILCFAAAGCQDIDWDFERMHWRWDWWNKPSRRPIRPSRQARGERRPRAMPVEPEARPEQPAATAGKQPEYRPASLAAPSGFYQLVLLSERGPAAGSGGTKHIRLKNVSAEAASKALAWLYVPIGRPGQETRRTLIYESPDLWEAATSFAPKLDVPVIDQPPQRLPIDPEKSFAQGIGLLSYVYRMNPARPADLAKLEHVEGLLNVTATSNAADPGLRWAAALVAGRIRADVQFDFEGAQRFLLIAQGYAPPGSVEEMMALFARAEAYRQDGQPDKAKPLYQQIVSQFGNYRESDTYRRAQREMQAD